MDKELKKIKTKENKRRWILNNPEKVKAQKKKSYEKNKEKIRLKKQIYYQKNKEIILKKSKENRENNKERKRSTDIIYRKCNKEKIKVKNSIYYQKNKEKIDKQNKEWEINNPEKIKEIKRRSALKHKQKTENNRKLRVKNKKNIIFNHYCNGTIRCICCNENNLEFLTIDHINGDGSKHRKKYKLKSGEPLYNSIIKNNFPSNFQILCYNCNMAKKDRIKCYHNRSLFKSPISKEYLSTKALIISVYSNNKSCICCGENELEFLSIDHINGGGFKHTKSIKNRGYNFYRWLIRNNFPKEYKILCYNCNCGKKDKKYCPHQDQPKPLNIQ